MDPTRPVNRYLIQLRQERKRSRTMTIAFAFALILVLYLGFYGVSTGGELVQTEDALQALARENADLRYELEELQLTLYRPEPPAVATDPLELLSETPTPTPTEEPEPEPTMELVGNFTVTFYDLCVSCCGKEPSHPAYGITASGETATDGITIATDPSVIPFGTQVYIEGIGYRTAQDTGGAIKGNIIDVYVPDHETGRQLGGLLKDVPVYIVKEEE